MKEKISRKEKAAQALARLVEDHMKTFPGEEQERMMRAFGLKVAELNRKRAKSSKARLKSRSRRQALTRG
jgi:hypothetical protein